MWYSNRRQCFKFVAVCRGHFNIRRCFISCRNSHCEDKALSRTSYFMMEICKPGKRIVILKQDAVGVRQGAVFTRVSTAIHARWPCGLYGHARHSECERWPRDGAAGCRQPWRWLVPGPPWRQSAAEQAAIAPCPPPGRWDWSRSECSSDYTSSRGYSGYIITGTWLQLTSQG